MGDGSESYLYHVAVAFYASLAFYPQHYQSPEVRCYSFAVTLQMLFRVAALKLEYRQTLPVQTDVEQITIVLRARKSDIPS